MAHAACPCSGHTHHALAAWLHLGGWLSPPSLPARLHLATCPTDVAGYCDIVPARCSTATQSLAGHPARSPVGTPSGLHRNYSPRFSRGPRVSRVTRSTCSAASSWRPSWHARPASRWGPCGRLACRLSLWRVRRAARCRSCSTRGEAQAELRAGLAAFSCGLAQRCYWQGHAWAHRGANAARGERCQLACGAGPHGSSVRSRPFLCLRACVGTGTRS